MKVPGRLECRREEALAQREIRVVLLDGEGLAFDDFNRTVVEALRLIDRASECLDFMQVILLLREARKLAIGRKEHDLLELVLRYRFLRFLSLQELLERAEFHLEPTVLRNRIHADNQMLILPVQRAQSLLAIRVNRFFHVLQFRYVYAGMLNPNKYLSTVALKHDLPS